MPEDVPPGGTGALLRGKRNLENSLSFLFWRFFHWHGGCWGWRGFRFCEVASHKFDFLHGKLLWRDGGDRTEGFLLAPVDGEGYGDDGFVVGRECGNENIRFTIFEQREGFLVFSCLEEGEGIGGA
jgi:hypothetical protein